MMRIEWVIFEYSIIQEIVFFSYVDLKSGRQIKKASFKSILKVLFFPSVISTTKITRKIIYFKFIMITLVLRKIKKNPKAKNERTVMNWDLNC